MDKIIKVAASTMYFGQMFIEEKFRGKSLIKKIGFILAMKHKLLHPRTKLFLWGDAIGYKPYLLLAKSFPEIYPSPDCPITPEIKKIRDFLGQKYYSSKYNKELGIVHKTKNRIKCPDAQIKSCDIENPLVEYYTRINKHYQRGDGVLVICPVTMNNITYSIKEYLRSCLCKANLLR
ncbi:MAG: hypothetical protein GY707_11205 [Desulfobacteraceae bacterium]|nr:hypothetical protein [Desulfobacteraceae bacterium]